MVNRLGIDRIIVAYSHLKSNQGSKNRHNLAKFVISVFWISVKKSVGADFYPEFFTTESNKITEISGSVVKFAEQKGPSYM
jgi:hypothetical protein